MKRWLDSSPTVGDVIVISLCVAWFFAMLAGLGAETNAKQYARELFNQIARLQ